MLLVGWAAGKMLASENWHEGSNAPSVRSPVMDEERMRPDHWLGLVLCVHFSASTLMVGWQEGHPAHKKLIPLIPRRFYSVTGGGGCPKGNQLTQVQKSIGAENRSLKCVGLVTWHSGRTSVFGQWTFLVLLSTCSWWVTTYMDKPSAIVNQLGQLSLSSLEVDKWVVSCNWMFATSVRGSTIWWMLLRKGRPGAICR